VKDVVTPFRGLDQRRQVEYVNVFELNVVTVGLDPMVNDYHFISGSNQMVHYVRGNKA
jgi:hypothetical protein